MFSVQAEEIQTRLDRNDPEKLSPFYLLRPFTVERGKEKICYDGYDEHYTVGKPDLVVEIEVTDCIAIFQMDLTLAFEQYLKKKELSWESKLK